MVTTKEDVRTVLATIFVVLFLLVCNAVETGNIIDILYLIFLGIFGIEILVVKIKNR